MLLVVVVLATPRLGRHHGRDLGEVLPVRPVGALLTPDGAVAVVHTEGTTEGWSTATRRRL